MHLWTLCMKAITTENIFTILNLGRIGSTFIGIDFLIFSQFYLVHVDCLALDIFTIN